MALWQILLVSTWGGLMPLLVKWLFDLGLHRLNIRGQKDIFIHKTQFEKEFEAYVQIWSNIPDLTNYVMTYDDLCSEKLIERREKNLPELLERTAKMISESEPFLHPTVFDSCVKYFNQINSFKKLDKKLNNFEKQVDANAVKKKGNVTESDDKEWHVLYEQWDRCLEQINQLQNQVKDSIRRRIWNHK